MKYKVGDRVRLNNGEAGTITHNWGELASWQETDFLVDGKLEIKIADISHIIVSEITDELIDRFKNEKIAWHFKTKEDLLKVVDVLSKRGMRGHSAIHSGRAHSDDFCLRYDEERYVLNYSPYDYYKSKGYEIIEIMNPVYIPYPIDIQTKPIYKGIDCEKMFQFYLKYKGLIEELKKL